MTQKAFHDFHIQKMFDSPTEVGYVCGREHEQEPRGICQGGA